MELDKKNKDLDVVDNSKIGKQARLSLPNPNEETNDYWFVPILGNTNVLPIKEKEPSWECSNMVFVYKKNIYSDGSFGWELYEVQHERSPKLKWGFIQDMIDKFEEQFKNEKP